MNEDQEVVLVDDAGELLGELDDNPSAAIQTDASEDEDPVLAAIQANPDKYKHLFPGENAAPVAPVRPAERPAAPQAREDTKPVWDAEKYSDYDDFVEDITDWKVAQAVGHMNGAVGPVMQREAASRHADVMAREAELDEVGKSFLTQELAKIPAQVMDHLSPDAKNIFILASRQYASDQAKAKGEAKNGVARASHAEPVAGVGQVRVQLADGVTRDDLNGYLAITGKKLDKSTVASLRQAGYLK